MNINSVMRMLPLRGWLWHCFLCLTYWYITNIANLLWWPLQPPGLIWSSCLSLYVHFISFHPHIPLQPPSSSMILACGCWGESMMPGDANSTSLSVSMPYILKESERQGSLHHILHNVSLLLFFWISSTSEISQDIFSSILFAIADSSSGIPWA